jgi:hypothetical protein
MRRGEGERFLAVLLAGRLLGEAKNFLVLVGVALLLDE